MQCSVGKVEISVTIYHAETIKPPVTLLCDSEDCQLAAGTYYKEKDVNTHFKLI